MPGRILTAFAARHGESHRPTIAPLLCAVLLVIGAFDAGPGIRHGQVSFAPTVALIVVNGGAPVLPLHGARGQQIVQRKPRAENWKHEDRAVRLVPGSSPLIRALIAKSIVAGSPQCPRTKQV